MEEENKIPYVDYWQVIPGKKNSNGDPVISIDPEISYVYPDNYMIKLDIRKSFPDKLPQDASVNEKDFSVLETFVLDRGSYKNSVNQLCQYIDYFTRFFDEEKEIMALYLYFKNKIDNECLTLTPSEFCKEIEKWFIWEGSHIRENVYKFVDYNNHIDITYDPKTKRYFNGEDDFTNEDIRRLLAASTIVKLVIPLVSQYTGVSLIFKMFGQEPEYFAYKIFVTLFYAYTKPPEIKLKQKRKRKVRKNKRKKPWEKGFREQLKKEQEEQQQEEVDESDVIMLKVYKFISKRVARHKKNHPTIWNQQEGLRGLSASGKEDELVIKYFFYDNFYKINFLHSSVSLMQSIAEYQLNVTINKLRYRKNPMEVDDIPDQNGLSTADKVAQTLPMIDETLIIRASAATQKIIDEIIKEVGEISEEEIEYYTTYCVRDKDNQTQDLLVQNYFAKRYNGFTELKTMARRYQIILLIALKRIVEEKGNKQLSYFLSARITGRMTSRLLQNSKYMNKLKSSEMYQRLIDNKYGVLKGDEEQDIILAPISRALNNRFTFVEYSMPELYGQIIEFDEDIISAEIMDLIDSI